MAGKRRIVFTVLKWLEKNQKINTYWPVKITWSSNFSVHKEFYQNAATLLISALSMATFAPQWEGWGAASDTAYGIRVISHSFLVSCTVTGADPTCLVYLYNNIVLSLTRSCPFCQNKKTALWMMCQRAHWSVDYFTTLFGKILFIVQWHCNCAKKYNVCWQNHTKHSSQHTQLLGKQQN